MAITIRLHARPPGFNPNLNVRNQSMPEQGWHTEPSPELVLFVEIGHLRKAAEL